MPPSQSRLIEHKMWEADVLRDAAETIDGALNQLGAAVDLIAEVGRRPMENDIETARRRCARVRDRIYGEVGKR